MIRWKKLTDTTCIQSSKNIFGGLMNWRSPLWRIWSKTIAVFVMVSFVFPYMAFAFEATTYPANPAKLQNTVPVKANGASVNVSPELGRVVSSYQGKSNKVIVYVHDLHCNYEVQSNIAALLGTLSKENGIQLIGVEGESATVSVDKLAKFPRESVKTNVGQYFLKRGRITGAEYLAATGQKPLMLEGIESQALYDQNKETLMKFLKEETQGHCEDLKTLLEKLKVPLYSTQLAKLDHFREQYDVELITLETYCNFLLEQAKEQGVSLGGFPVLNLYAATHKLPVSTDSDYDKLLSDASDLDRGIRERLYTSQDQRLLDHYLFLLRIMSNMLTISATAKDLDYYRTHKSEFSVTKLVGFLDNLCYRNAVSSDLDPGVVKLDEYLVLAANFYDVADQRSDAFVENILSQMDKHKQNAAVLITGGFHHFGVENAFKKRGISFITVKPRITRTYDENPYFSLLRNKRVPAEELLAQKENLFAPRSAFNDMVFLKYMTSVLNIDLLRELMDKSHDSQDFQAAYLDALKQYTPGANDTMFDFDQMQSNLQQKIYAFPVKGANYSVVLRPSKVAGDTSAYQKFIKAKEELGNGYEFEIVETATLQANRGKILGIEDKAQARSGILASVQAGLKSVSEFGTRVRESLTSVHPGYLAGAIAGIVIAFVAAPFVTLPLAAFSATQVVLVGAFLLAGFLLLSNAKTPEWAKAAAGMSLGLVGATLFQQLGPWVMNASVSTASAMQTASLAPSANSGWLGMLGGFFLPVLGVVSSSVGTSENGRGVNAMPEDDLIAKAIAFSQQTIGFGRPEFEGSTFRTTVETVVGRLKELTASDQGNIARVRFVLEQGLKDPQLLALFSVIWHQTPLTTLNAEGITEPDQAKSPEEKVLEFARDLAQGEQLAKYLNQGRKVPANLLANGNSYLAQLINTVGVSAVTTAQEKVAPAEAVKQTQEQLRSEPLASVIGANLAQALGKANAASPLANEWPVLELGQNQNLAQAAEAALRSGRSPKDLVAVRVADTSAGSNAINYMVLVDTVEKFASMNKTAVELSQDDLLANFQAGVNLNVDPVAQSVFLHTIGVDAKLQGQKLGSETIEQMATLVNQLLPNATFSTRAINYRLASAVMKKFNADLDWDQTQNSGFLDLVNWTLMKLQVIQPRQTLTAQELKAALQQAKAKEGQSAVSDAAYLMDRVKTLAASVAADPQAMAQLKQIGRKSVSGSSKVNVDVSTGDPVADVFNLVIKTMMLKGQVPTVTAAVADASATKGKTLALGAEVDSLHPERLLALSIFKNQTAALRKLAAAHGVKLSVDGPVFSSVLGFHPEDAQMLETYKKAVDVARAVGVSGIVVNETLSADVKKALDAYAEAQKGEAQVALKQPIEQVEETTSVQPGTWAMGDQSVSPAYTVQGASAVFNNAWAQKATPVHQVNLKQLPIGTEIHYQIADGHWDYSLRVEADNKVSIWLGGDQGRILADIDSIQQMDVERATPVKGILDDTQTIAMPYFYQTPWSAEGLRSLVRVEKGHTFNAVPQKMQVLLPEGQTASPEAMTRLTDEEMSEIRTQQQAPVSAAEQMEMLALPLFVQSRHLNENPPEIIQQSKDAIRAKGKELKLSVEAVEKLLAQDWSAKSWADIKALIAEAANVQSRGSITALGNQPADTLGKSQRQVTFNPLKVLVRGLSGVWTVIKRYISLGLIAIVLSSASISCSEDLLGPEQALVWSPKSYEQVRQEYPKMLDEAMVGYTQAFRSYPASQALFTPTEFRQMIMDGFDRLAQKDPRVIKLYFQAMDKIQFATDLQSGAFKPVNGQAVMFLNPEFYNPASLDGGIGAIFKLDNQRTPTKEELREMIVADMAAMPAHEAAHAYQAKRGVLDGEALWNISTVLDGTLEAQRIPENAFSYNERNGRMEAEANLVSTHVSGDARWQWTATHLADRDESGQAFNGVLSAMWNDRNWDSVRGDVYTGLKALDEKLATLGVSSLEYASLKSEGNGKYTLSFYRDNQLGKVEVAFGIPAEQAPADALFSLPTKMGTNIVVTRQISGQTLAPQGAKGAVVDLAQIQAKSKSLSEAAPSIRAKVEKVLGTSGIAVQADGKGVVDTATLLGKVNAALDAVAREKDALETKARRTADEVETLKQHGEAVKQLEQLKQQLSVPGVRSINLRISEGMDPRLHGLAVVDGETVYLNANQIDKFSESDRTKLTKLVMHEISHVVATGIDRQGEIGAYILGRLGAGYQMGIRDVVKEVAKVDAGIKAITVSDISGSSMKLAAAGAAAKGLAFTPAEVAQVKKAFQERNIISIRTDGTRETGKAFYEPQKLNIYINTFSPDSVARVMQAKGISKVEAVIALAEGVYQHETFHRRVKTGDRQNKFFNNQMLFGLFQSVQNAADSKLQELASIVETVVGNLYGYPRTEVDEKGIPVLFEEAVANYIEVATAIKAGDSGSYNRDKIFVLAMNQLLAQLKARLKDPQLGAFIDKVTQMAGTQSDYQKPVQIDFTELSSYLNAYRNGNAPKTFDQTATGKALSAYFGLGTAVAAKGKKVQASKDLRAARTETFAEVDQRSAGSLVQPSTTYQQMLQKHMNGIRASLQHSITDAALRARAEQELANLVSGKTALAVRTVAAIEGGIAVQNLSAGKLDVIMEAQMPQGLRESTFVHEAVEAVLQQLGVQRAHAIAFVTEQAVFPESMALKLQDINQSHYDASHLAELAKDENLQAELVAIDQQTGVNPYVKDQQKANAQRVADAAKQQIQLIQTGQAKGNTQAYTDRNGKTMEIPVVAYADLPVGKRLNHGSYSNVYTAEFNGKQVAFLARKAMDPQAGGDFQLPTMNAQEIQNFNDTILETYANYQTYAGLTYQNHPVAPEIYAVVKNENGQVIGYLSELLPGKELSELTVVGALSEAQLESALTQLKDQLLLLHSKGLRHGDVRGENTLVRVNSDGSVVARYIDFWEANGNWSEAEDMELYNRMEGVARWEIQPENVAQTLAQRKAQKDKERNQKFLNEHRKGIETLNDAFYSFREALQDNNLDAADEVLGQMRRVVRVGTKETRLWTLDDFKELQGALAKALPEFLAQINTLVGAQAPVAVIEAQKNYVDQLNKLNEEWSAFFGVPLVQTKATEAVASVEQSAQVQTAVRAGEQNPAEQGLVEQNLPAAVEATTPVQQVAASIGNLNDQPVPEGSTNPVISTMNAITSKLSMTVLGIFAAVTLASCPQSLKKDRGVPTLAPKAELLVKQEAEKRTVQVGLIRDGVSSTRTFDVPESAGTREILSQAVVQIPNGTMLQLVLKKSPEDLKALERGRTMAINNVRATLAKTTELGLSAKSVKALNRLLPILENTPVDQINIVSNIALEGQAPNAMVDEKGRVFLAAELINNEEWLAGSLVHENLHPIIDNIYQIPRGDYQGYWSSETKVVDLTVSVMGPMVDAAVVGNETDGYKLMLTTIDLKLKANDPHIQQAVIKRVAEELKKLQGKSGQTKLKQFLENLKDGDPQKLEPYVTPLIDAIQKAVKESEGQRGFYGNKTEAALTGILQAFFATNEDVRAQVAALAAQNGIVIGVGVQLSREAVRFAMNNLTAYQMKAFYDFFGKKGSIKSVRDSQNYLTRGFKNLRTSLRGTMYEAQATKARKLLDRMRSGEAVPVKVEGQVRTISGIEIRRINAKDASQLSPEVAQHVNAIGAFFSMEGNIGVINVMNNVDLEEAAIHEFIEAVAGEDHETVTKMQEFAKYSLGTMSVSRSFWRQFAWPTRIVATIGAAAGMLAVGVTVGFWIGLGVVSAGVIAALVGGVFLMIWGLVNFGRNKFVITIDGPDASGKKEIAQVLSRYYRYPYVEAGTYYRTFAQILKESGWNRQQLLDLSKDLDNPKNRDIFEKVIVAKLKGVDLDMAFDRRAVDKSMRVYAQGKEMGGRKELTDVVMPSPDMNADQRAAYLETEAMASALGKFAGIEEIVNAQIQKLAKQRNIIVVGQTMGSTLFRKTGQLKFYVTNDDYRARAEKFHHRHFFSDAEIKAAAQALQKRDESDGARARNPLKPVAGAVVLNTGDFDLFEIIDKAKENINIRSNIFVRMYQAARNWSQPLRVLSRAEGEVARMEALEKGAWQGLGDVDNLSLNNHFYGKNMADFIIQDVLDSMIRTVKSTEVRRILFYYRVQKVRELARAVLNVSEWKLIPKIFMQLRDNQIKIIRQGGDEIITLVPGHLPEEAVTDIQNMIRSEVSLHMTDAMSFDVRNLQPAQLGDLKAAIDRINKDFGDKKLVRLAVDAFGPHLYVNVGRNDLAGKFEKEMKATGATLAEDQKTGRLIVSIIQKRLREAKLEAATLDLLDIAKITSPEEQKATDKEGLQYLKDGRNLRVTMTIGAILGSAVVQEKFRQKLDSASEEEARALLDAWSKDPQSSGKIKIEEGVAPKANLEGAFKDVIKTQRLGVAIPMLQESTAELSNVLVEASGAIIHGLKQSIGKNNVEVRSVATNIVPIKDNNFSHSLIGESVQKELASRTEEYNKLRRDENGYARETDENGNMLFDALVPWQYSAYGLEFFAREHIKNANKYNRMVPKVMVGRAPPSAGPDKINLLVFGKDKTHLIEVEGQYFGPFVTQVTENIAAALAKERGLTLEAAKRDTAFMAEVNEKAAALVVGQLEDENLPLLKFKAINDYISYGAGDEMIAMPHLYVKDVVDALQQGRVEEALPRFLDRLEAKINNPQNQNTAKVRLAAVYSSVSTADVMTKGIEQLQQEVQIAGMARTPADGRIVPFQAKHVSIAREVLLGKARTKLLDLFKNPSAHAKVEAEIRARQAQGNTSWFSRLATRVGLVKAKATEEGYLKPAVEPGQEQAFMAKRFGREYSSLEEQFAALQAMYAVDPVHIAKPIRLEYDEQGKLKGYRMERIDGVTLLQYMDETGKALPEAMRNEIREVVTRLHEAGLVHGDLNATNIMVSRDGKSFKLIDPIGYKQGLQEFGEYSEMALTEAMKEDLKSLDFTFSLRSDDLAAQTVLENTLIRKLPADMPSTPLGRLMERWKNMGQKGLSIGESLQANQASVAMLPGVARMTARLGAPMQHGIVAAIWSGLVSFVSAGALVWQAVSLSVGSFLRRVVVDDTLRMLGHDPSLRMQEFMKAAMTMSQAANTKLTPEELMDEVTLVQAGERVIDKAALDAKSKTLDVQSEQGKALYAILKGAGLEVRSDGKFGISAERIHEAILATQARLADEYTQTEKRRDALSRIASQKATVEELNATLEVNQTAQKLLKSLGESLGARLSDAYDIRITSALVRQSGLAFRGTESAPATVYVSQKKIEKALAKNDRAQLVRLFMHEGGHMLGLPGTAEGEAMAGILSRVLAGYQLSGADIMNEVSKIEKGHRLLLGDGPWAAQGGNVKERYQDAQAIYEFLSATPEKKQAMRADPKLGPRLEGFIRSMATMAAMNKDFSMGTDAEIADSSKMSPAAARAAMKAIADAYTKRGNTVEYKAIDPWRGYPEYYKVVAGPDEGAELYIDGVRNITLDEYAKEGHADIWGNVEGITPLLPVNAGLAKVGNWISGLAQYMNAVIKSTGQTVGPHFHIGSAKPIENAGKMRMAWTEIEGYVLPMVASILDDVTPAIPLLHDRSNPANFASNEEESMGAFGRFISWGRGQDGTEAEHEKFFNVMVKSDGHMEFRMRYPITDPEVMLKLFVLFSAVYNYMESRSKDNGLARRWDPMPFAAYYAQGVNRNQNINDLGEFLTVMNLIISKRNGDSKPFFDKQKMTEFYTKQFLPVVDKVASRPEAMSQFSLDPDILNPGVSYADIKEYMKELASDLGMDPEFAAQGAVRAAGEMLDTDAIARTARLLGEAKPSVQDSIGKVLKMAGMEINAEGKAVFRAEGLNSQLQRALTTLEQERAALEKKAVKSLSDQATLAKYDEARALLESLAATLGQQGTKTFDIYLSQSMDPKLHGLAVVSGNKLFLNSWQVNKLSENNRSFKLMKLLMHEIGHIGGVQATATGEAQAAVLARIASGATMSISDITREVEKTDGRLVLNATESQAATDLAAVGAAQALAFSPEGMLMPLGGAETRLPLSQRVQSVMAAVNQSLPLQMLKKAISLPSGAGFLFRQFGLTGSLRGASAFLVSVVLIAWAGVTAFAAQTGINLILPMVVVGMATLLPTRYLTFRFQAIARSQAVKDALESPAIQTALERLGADAQLNPMVVTTVARELLKTLERVADDPQVADEVLKALAALSDIPGIDATTVRVQLADGMHTYAIPTEVLTRPSLLNRLMILPVVDQDQRPVERKQNSLTLDSAA